jgi:UDP-N-acetylmuramoyl-L-alanyl-D-glutamate--2,6-diaminopimelate ligase
MQRAGVGFVVMEVSSHALAQERVSSVDFSYAIFTNLTHDHLDYHLNMDAYFKAKARLFKAMPKNTVSIFNIDDPYARRLLNMTCSRVITYGLGSRAMVSARDIRFSIRSTRFIAKTPKATIEITSPLIGRHNLYNVLAAISLGTAVGLRPDTTKNAIAKFKPVPGRLERVDRGGDFSVFVDYAHTDDALKNVLTTLKELTASRIIVVFGCGGNRDKAKRPKMGRVASELSDFAIITSDNPRNESPRDIIADILSGITTKNFKVIADRRAAILGSIKMARPGDVILVAGKGHETQQIFKNRSIHFDDRETVRQCLELMS